MKLATRVFALILLVAGIGCIRQGFVGLRGSGGAPRLITCAKLSETGPGGNSNFTITDLHPLINQVVVVGGDGKTSWNEAYIPLVPSNSAGGSGFHVLLHSTAINTSRDLRAFKSTDRISGSIETRAADTSEKVKPLLQTSYPEIDLANCWIVEHNVVPMSRSMGALLCVIGAVFITVSILAIRGTFRNRGSQQNIPAAPEHAGTA